MQLLSRLVLVRHGETEGESSIRFHGITDVALNDLGRAQAREARKQVPGDRWDLVVTSSLCRAWQTALIIAPGRKVRLEADFREIDFGRWEGLTKEEIAARDPILYQDWQGKVSGFEFPDGERRADFRARTLRGLERVMASGATSVILVAHKGVVRTIAEGLTGQTLPEAEPELGGVLRLVRSARDSWRITHGGGIS
jgi:broad specificity phosphatase PhoE